MIVTAMIENTFIYLGCADEKTGEILFKITVATSLEKTITDYSITIREVFRMENIDRKKITGGVVASVVPLVTETFKTAMAKVFNIKVIEVGPGVKSGVDTRIDAPTTLGSDMLVAAVSAISEYKAPMILVAISTNTTISVIDSNKRFVGRIIFPGVKNSFDTVYEYSALIGSIGIKTPDKVIGTTTEKAVQSGVIFGCASSIDGFIERIKAELKVPEINVILTGTYGPMIAPHCLHKNVVLDPNLMTKGLIHIYNKNCKS